MRLVPERVRKAIKPWRYLPRILRLFWRTSPLVTCVRLPLDLLQHLLPLAGLWITKLIVDDVTGQRNGNLLWLVVAFVLFTGAGYAIGNLLFAMYVYMRSRLPIYAQTLLQVWVNDLKGIAVFEDPRFHDALENARRGSGRLSGTLQLLGGMFGTFWELVGVAVLMGGFSFWVPIVVFASAIPRALLQSRFAAGEWEVNRSSASEVRKMDYFSGLVTGAEHAKEIRLFDLGGVFLSAYRDAFGLLFFRLRGIWVRSAVWNGVAAVISVCGTGGVYVFLAVRAAMGAITIGDLVLYTGLLIRLHNSLLQASSGSQNVYRRLLDLSLFFDLFDLEAPRLPRGSRVRTSGVLASEIEFQDVTFFYPGADRPALEHFSLRFKPGEIVALVGPNGAGKSTVVKLLTRLYDPNRGCILLDGTDIREYDVDALRQGFAAVLQDFVRYHLTARENIGFGQVGAMEDEARVRTAARRGQAWEVIERLPRGLDTVLGREFPEGLEVSGGEWQKMGISRGFMRGAEILILDEPTAALDARSESALYEKFAEMVRGKTALFISHRLSTVRMADRIAVVERGQVIEEGSHESLMEKKGRYAGLFVMQAERYQK